MFKSFIYIRHRSAKLFKNTYISVGSFLFYAYHLFYESGKPCAFGTIKYKLEFLKMPVRIIQHFVHASAGELSHNFRLLIIRQCGKILLCRLKYTQKIIVVLSDYSLKKLLFAFIISVKCARSHAQRSHNVTQGGLFIALFHKLGLSRLMYTV